MTCTAVRLGALTTGLPMRAGKRAEQGFTYLWLLAAMAVLGVAMAAVGPLYTLQTQRDREAELFHVGAAYARAIEHYYATSPGQASLPRSVDDLVADPRFPSVVHHLREAYPDPLDASHPMVPVFDLQGHLIGVHSSSDAQPLRRVGWTDGRHMIAPAAKYSDWLFMAQVSR